MQKISKNHVSGLVNTEYFYISLYYIYLVNEKKIEKIWTAFSESGNSNEGKIIKTIFKKVFANKLDEKNEVLLDLLFESKIYFNFYK